MTEWRQAHNQNVPCYNWLKFDYLNSPSNNIVMYNCSDIVGTGDSKNSHVADDDKQTDSFVVYLEVTGSTLQ